MWSQLSQSKSPGSKTCVLASTALGCHCHVSHISCLKHLAELLGKQDHHSSKSRCNARSTWVNGMSTVEKFCWYCIRGIEPCYQSNDSIIASSNRDGDYCASSVGTKADVHLSITLDRSLPERPSKGFKAPCRVLQRGDCLSWDHSWRNQAI